MPSQEVHLRLESGNFVVARRFTDLMDSRSVGPYDLGRKTFLGGSTIMKYRGGDITQKDLPHLEFALKVLGLTRANDRRKFLSPIRAPLTGRAQVDRNSLRRSHGRWPGLTMN